MNKIKPLILVKIGTRLLTKNNQKLDYKCIQNIINQIAKLHKEFSVILVSSGAVGAGREFIAPDIKDPITQKQVLASLGQAKLMQIYFDFFQKKKILIAQALITKEDFQKKESYFNMKEVFCQLLEKNIIPIINENDVTSSFENTFGDNDQLAALTAALMQAEKMVLLSDIDGLFTSDPKENVQAKAIREIKNIDTTILQYAKKTLSDGGTGGMYSKLQAAQITTDHGITTVLCNGKNKDALLKAVYSGKESGTLFLPKKKKKLSFYGKWIKTVAKIEGKIFIDSGAVTALKQGKSLLAVGITSMEGNFKKRGIVLILSDTGIRVALGVSREDGAKLKEILFSNKKKGVTIVHCDYLYLL